MQDDSQTPADDAAGQAHPLARAHSFFQKAAPVIRDAAEAIERHGGIEQVRETVVERATELVAKADDAIAKATAIEGVVVERSTAEATAPQADPAAVAREERRRSRRRLHYLELALLAFAATFGALVLQRRLRR